MDLFRRKGLVLVVDGTEAPEAVQNAICRGLGLEEGGARVALPAISA